MPSSLQAPFAVEISQRHAHLVIDVDRLRAVVIGTLRAQHITSADISVVLTDDVEIQRINREYLGHDYPTDVISFPLEEATGSREFIEGELIISLDTAARVAGEQGWSVASEVILYVVHGLLHFCGFDDQSETARLLMRQREREILALLDLPSGTENPTAAGWDDGSA